VTLSTHVTHLNGYDCRAWTSSVSSLSDPMRGSHLSHLKLGCNDRANRVGEDQGRNHLEGILGGRSVGLRVFEAREYTYGGSQRL